MLTLDFLNFTHFWSLFSSLILFLLSKMRLRYERELNFKRELMYFYVCVTFYLELWVMLSTEKKRKNYVISFFLDKRSEYWKWIFYFFLCWNYFSLFRLTFYIFTIFIYEKSFSYCIFLIWIFYFLSRKIVIKILYQFYFLLKLYMWI